MKILIAEDDPLTLRPYRIALEAKNHQVFTCDNGEDCFRIYREEFGAMVKNNIFQEENKKKAALGQQQQQQDPILSTSSLPSSQMKAFRERHDDCYNISITSSRSSPFDAVILDYRMPKKDGIEVAKEILCINPNQRIIFASAYVKETLKDAVKELKRAVELMQKPFKLEALIDTIEDMEIYEQLKKLQVDADAFKAANLTHEEVSNLLEAIIKIQKGRTF